MPGGIQEVMLRRSWRLFLALDVYEKLFFLLTAIQAGAVWLHRSFPTQDGPFQIYIADVFSDLIRGGGNYSSYYQVQGYAHPYSFTQYALLLLNQVFQPLTSERLLVCGYFIGFALGVRYLIRSIDPANHWLPLFLLPFALNAYLTLGIYNFSFAMALLMFMMGVWLRWAAQWTVSRSLLWLSLSMLLASMHHVPLLILGVFSGVHIAARPVRADRIHQMWRTLRWDAVNVALLVLPLAWYGVFALASARSVAPTISVVQVTWADRIHALMQMLPLSPYLGSGYCFCMVMLAVAPVGLFMLRTGEGTFARASATACISLLAAAAVCLAVYVFGPHFLFGHGHGYFAERMAVPFLICGLAALAPVRLTNHHQTVAAIFLTGVFAFMLFAREQYTGRMVADLAPLYDVKPAARGSSGAIISGAESLAGLNFNPYYWAGALYAQQRKSILLNASWTYEPISLFATKDAHPWDDTTSPAQIREVLLENRAVVSPPIEFLCGGKWDTASRESASTLAGRIGLTLVFDSNVYYCYGNEPTPPASDLARR